MKLLSFISDHLLLCVFLSLLWGTTDSSGANTTYVTTQAETTTTQKTTTNLPTSTTQSSTSLASTATKSAPKSVNDVTVVGQNETSIRLKWEKVNNISTYILQYKSSGSTTEMNISVSQEGSIEYVVTSLTAATKYNFTLFTVFEGVNSSGYTFSAVTAPESVQSVTVKTRNETSITLQWKKVSNTDTYTLEFNQRKISVLASAENVTYTVVNLTAGTRYNFSLFAVFVNVTSSGVNHIAVTAPKSVNDVTVVGKNETSIRLMWNKVNNISTYTLQYKSSGSSTRKNINVSQKGLTEHVVSPLTDGTAYSFTLFTVLEGVSSSGYTFSAVTVPGNVQNVTVVGQNETSIRLRWEKVNNISTYTLQYKSSGSTTEMNINVSQEGSIEYVVSPLTAATKYNFILFTVLEGFNSSGYTFSAVTAPENVWTVTPVAQTNSSITLNWSKTNNISEYILKYDKEEYINKPQEDPIVHVVTSLTAGTKYSFTLFTVFEGVRSSGSPISAVTAPCDAVEFRSLCQNETSITLQWKKASNTDTYILEFNGRTISVPASAEDVTYTVVNLTAGTRYNFSLFAVFVNVTSSGVNHIAVTAPKSVNDVTVVGQNETSIRLKWEKVNNISTYTLQYKSSGNATEMNISVSQLEPTEHVVSPLTAGTKYTFTLFTVFEGVRSSGYTFTAVTVPLNTKQLKTLTQNETSITLEWEKVPSVEMYTLVFNENELNITSVEVVTYSVGNLASGSRYNFSFFTVFGNVRSTGVNHSAVTVPPMVSSVNVTERFTNNITIKWENMNEAWDYLLDISGSVSDSSDDSSNIVTKVVTALNPGTEYNFTLTTRFSGLNSTAYSNFTVTAIDCASADWTATNSSIKGRIEGLFSNATASNGSQISVSPEGKNVSFTGLYPGSTYEISLVYEKSSRRFLQCHHKVTVLPPNLNAHCEYRAAGYSVLIAWNEPDGEWTAVEVNVAETNVTKNRSEKWVVIDGFQPAKKYKVSVTSLSGPHGTVRSSEPHVFNCETDPRGVIAGSVFAVLLFGLLVALVVFIFLKRPHIISRKKSFIGGSKVSNTRNIAISAEKFPAHFRQLSLDENRGFSEEYEDLAPVGTEQTRKTAILPENKAKNRFTNILPYDWCRVKLSTLDPNGTSDYINANYMPGYSSAREYIATQGPLPSTVNDFWRMIWEQRVKRIVMVTNCTEGGRIKCEQYWPADRKPSIHGDLQVTVRSEQPEHNWTLREFSLKDRNASEERRVKHFHFTAWPDHGVPQGTEILIEFRGLVRQHIEREESKAPTVIHCSAGVGRTGTIIALDVLLQQLEKKQAVGINDFVRKMRLNRPYMVQTESQYIFLHQCIMDRLQPKKTNEENVYENADIIYANATALHELRRHNANA